MHVIINIFHDKYALLREITQKLSYRNVINSIVFYGDMNKGRYGS